MHLVWELIDNAVDEAAAGFASRLDVLLHRDGSVEISDNGRGIPVDIHSAKSLSFRSCLTNSTQEENLAVAHTGVRRVAWSRCIGS